MSASKGASIAGLLSFGTLTSLLAKVVFQLKGDGLHGDNHAFEKPYFMVLVMFVSMSACVPMYIFNARSASSGDESARKDNYTALTDDDQQLSGDAAADGQGEETGGRKRTSLTKQCLLLAIPTAFDLIATVLMNVGLLTVTASVYQMMRSAELVFAAIFGVFFLKRRLILDHFVAIGCAMAGVALVGVANLLSDPAAEGGDSKSDTAASLTGMLLICASQAVQAAQLTFEDTFLHDFDIDVTLLVGAEGVWGTIMTVAVLAVVQFTPNSDGGVVEDTADTFAMLKNTQKLLIIVVVQGAGLFLYNFFGCSVTGNFSAVFRTVLETLRTLFVWAVDLVLFYGHVGGGLGERWTAYSPMQALGFVFLVLATLIYASGDAQLAKEAMQAELDEERDSEGGGDGAAPSTRSPMMAPVEEDRPMPGVGVSPRASPIDSYSESSAVSIGSRLQNLVSTDIVYSSSIGKTGMNMNAISPAVGSFRGLSASPRPRLDTRASPSGSGLPRNEPRVQRSGGFDFFSNNTSDTTSPGGGQDDGASP